MCRFRYRCSTLALMAIGIKPGDEVITTPFTWGSNSEMIKFVGAKPVYADINLDDFNIDTHSIQNKITKNKSHHDSKSIWTML